jgi:hypothetical protein
VFEIAGRRAAPLRANSSVPMIGLLAAPAPARAVVASIGR